MTEDICVSLDSWIIQDGNYGDFARGDRRAFALEFHAEELVAVPDWETTEVSFRRQRGAAYKVRARKVFEAAGWRVIDFGLLAYSEDGSIVPGDGAVRGRIELGVDPFTYFERLARTTDAPALIYDWEIRQIERGVLPGAAPGDDSTLPRAAAPLIEVDRTKAWTDEGGRATYLLHCRRLPGEPRRTLQP